MAMARFLLVLSISSLVFTVKAAVGQDSLEQACSMTTFSDSCMETLKSTPGIRTAASPRDVALAGLRYLLKEGEPLVQEAQRVLDAEKSSTGGCLAGMQADLKSHLKILSSKVAVVPTAAPEQTAAFGVARDALRGIVDDPNQSQGRAIGCSLNEYVSPQAQLVAGKMFKYDDLMRDTYEIMEHVQPAAAGPANKGVEKKE